MGWFDLIYCIFFASYRFYLHTSSSLFVLNLCSKNAYYSVQILVTLPNNFFKLRDAMFHSLFFSFSFQLMKFELIFVCPYFVDSGEKGALSPISVYPAMGILSTWIKFIVCVISMNTWTLLLTCAIIHIKTTTKTYNKFRQRWNTTLNTAEQPYDHHY